MPGINGIEFFEQVAKHNRQLVNQIIRMTGDTASMETASFLANIDNTIMNKQFTLNNVKENIKHVMGSL